MKREAVQVQSRRLVARSSLRWKTLREAVNIFSIFAISSSQLILRLLLPFCLLPCCPVCMDLFCRRFHQAIAKCISPLAEHVFEAGKVLHIVLPGCNTINLCYHLKESLPEQVHHIVYILCTSDVWPGDLSHIMWSQYGTNLTADLSHFRAATRSILDEYTHHYKRQRILDQSMQATAKKKSRQRLSDAVYLDRLDRICIQNSGQNIEMQSL